MQRTPEHSLQLPAYQEACLYRQPFLGCFRSFQIIIIENTNHMAGIPLDDNINIVEFSKDKHNGRYGYLDGIYDVSDES